MTLPDSNLEKVKTCMGVVGIDNGLGTILPKMLLNANKSKTTAPAKTMKTPRMSSKKAECAAYVQSLFDLRRAQSDCPISIYLFFTFSTDVCYYSFIFIFS